MATLATFLNKRATAMTASAHSATSVRAESDPFRLRALPNDDIYFRPKVVDNSRVVRQADPNANTQCWSAVSAAAVILMLGATIVAPSVASILDGYKLESLKQEHQSLLDRKRSLEVREAALLSPERLNELAKEQKLSSPVSGQIYHLDTPAPDSHLAKTEGEKTGVTHQ